MKKKRPTKKQSTEAAKSLLSAGKVRMKKNPKWTADARSLAKLVGQAGPVMYKRVSTAWRLYSSPEFRAKLAKETSGKPWTDESVLELIENEYFTDTKNLKWPLGTLFAIYRTVPAESEWGPDWPTLLSRVPMAEKPKSAPRNTATVAEREALRAEFEAYKEQMALELKRKDAEIGTLKADLAKARRRITTLEKQVENLKQQLAGKPGKKAS